MTMSNERPTTRDDDSDDFDEDHDRVTQDSIWFPWAIDDDVKQLRLRGTSHVYLFPTLEPMEYLLPNGRMFTGRMEEMTLGALEDLIRQPREKRSPITKLLRIESAWTLLNLSAEADLRMGIGQQPTVRLAPAMEVGIEGATLIAESARSIDLHAFLAMLIGEDEHSHQVDDALSMMCGAQRSTSPIILQGPGNLTEVARELHRMVYPSERPFVTYNASRCLFESQLAGQVRDVAISDAISAARGGTLCLRSSELPPNCRELQKEHERSSGTQRQIIVWHDVEDPLAALLRPILVSSVEDRQRRRPS
jgi:hypothetical protein